MRFMRAMGFTVWAVTLALAAAADVAAASDLTQCRKLALEKKALEKAGMDNYLEKSPESVAAERGRSFLERVRAYIELSETVLFKCPPDVLNATKMALGSSAAGLPPLPVKGPAKARRPAPSRQLVPLPVKRQSRRWRPPASQS